METDRTWYAMDGGDTIGERGPGKGTIVADAEYGDPLDADESDARITLERTHTGTYVLTGQVYPWAFGQCEVATMEAAEVLAETMRDRLEIIANAIPGEQERNLEAKTTQLQQLCHAFEHDFMPL